MEDNYSTRMDIPVNKNGNQQDQQREAPDNNNREDPAALDLAPPAIHIVGQTGKK